MLFRIDSCKECNLKINAIDRCSYCGIDSHIIVDDNNLRQSCPLKKLMVPCKVGDMLWFNDKFNSISWGIVIGFTETHVMVKSAYTENKSVFEMLPYKEFGISVIISDDREDAERRMIFPVNEKSYWEDHDFKFGGKIK